MNMDTITGPMGSLRVQVLRLSALVAAQSRHAGEVALRGSASALTRTAQRLDTLADRIADAPATEARDERTASGDPHAEAVKAEAVKAEEVKAEEVIARETIAEPANAEPTPVDVADASPSAILTDASAQVSKPEHGASTPEAAPYESKKKHRQERRRR